MIRADDYTPTCYDDIMRAEQETRDWHDQPLDIQRLQNELRLSLAHRNRRNRLVDISPWVSGVSVR